MLRWVFFILLASAQAGTAVAASCAGADPAIVSVSVANVTTQGALNRYHFTGRVINLGSSAQPSNVLQFVDIYQNGIRKDDRGIPPLRPGQSYTFGYDYLRSTEAGAGTSRLTFRIRMRQPQSPSSQDCNLGNDRYVVRFSLSGSPLDCSGCRCHRNRSGRRRFGGCPRHRPKKVQGYPHRSA